MILARQVLLRIGKFRDENSCLVSFTFCSAFTTTGDNLFFSISSRFIVRPQKKFPTKVVVYLEEKKIFISLINFSVKFVVFFLAFFFFFEIIRSSRFTINNRKQDETLKRVSATFNRQQNFTTVIRNEKIKSKLPWKRKQWSQQLQTVGEGIMALLVSLEQRGSTEGQGKRCTYSWMKMEKLLTLQTFVKRKKKLIGHFGVITRGARLRNFLFFFLNFLNCSRKSPKRLQVWHWYIWRNYGWTWRKLNKP